MDYRPAIASMSLGRAWVHDFDNKLTQAAHHRFEGIEIFYEDLEYLAKDLAKCDSNINKSEDDSPTTAHLITAAHHVRKLTDSLHLTIIGLQPFLFYEGLLDRAEHDRLISKLKVWFRLVKILGTDTIQIPANFLPADKLTSDRDIITADLLEVAELGLRETPPVRFAYEQLCWSTHIDTWEQGWEIVKKVDRPNFGLCLDTFNIAGRVWGDPAAVSGQTPNAEEDLQASLRRMVEEIDVNKVFYIQVVDAERMEQPLVKGHPFYVEGQPARMSWSRSARTFLYEDDRGAYLPAEDVARVIIHELGYKGYVSMELFSRTASEEGEGVPEVHARRGIESWNKLVTRLDLK